MGALDSIELLESVHHFPCPYMFKAIGKMDRGFVARVVAGVREALAAEVDPPYRVRETANGRHVSVTLEPVVNSAEQVLAVYHRIQRTAGLVMLW